MWYWSSNVVPFYFIIYTFASLTDHSKACNDMDIDSITVGFSNIASPSKQNPTVCATEVTSNELHSSLSNRYGEYTLTVCFACDSKDHIILLFFSFILH